MPGVAEQIRRTQLKQEQDQRRADMQNLIRLVKENRLHEADAHQLEILKMALELRDVLTDKKDGGGSQVDTAALIAAVKEALVDILPNLSQPEGSVGGESGRPTMKHTSLVDFEHVKEDVSVEHEEGLGQDGESQEDSADKLRKLKRLKGNN